MRSGLFQNNFVDRYISLVKCMNNVCGEFAIKCHVHQYLLFHYHLLQISGSVFLCYEHNQN
jgi:hypothetical protein